MTGPELPNRLYDLLPAIHRMRDELAGGMLRELLAVIEEQVDVVERDIDRLYDNWFIETCDDWVVPYLGDLIGYRPIAEAGSADPSTAAGGRAARILVPRRDVATTIGNRRRKGTLALVEDLAGTAADWPARAVEYAPLLGCTQHLDHLRPCGGAYADLRSTWRLDRLDGPFDDVAHRPDVRRPTSHRTPGRYGIPDVGLHVWRLRSYPVTRARAACIEREGAQCYTVSVLGNDTQLYGRRRPEADPSHIAEEIDLPVPVRRRAFEHRISEHPLVATASAKHYGPDRDLWIEVVDWPREGRSGPIPAEDVVPADLSDWHAYRAPEDKVLVDPERGRLVFPLDRTPEQVHVSYRYGFSADMGGGEYRRTVSQPTDAPVYRVRGLDPADGEFRSVRAAYRQWREDREAAGDDPGVPPAAVIEVMDSGVYGGRLAFALADGEYLQVRAAPGTRPTLRLLDHDVDRPDWVQVGGGPGARFVLDGFLVTGRGLRVVGPGTGRNGGVPDGMCDITIRHCTLVPGWALDCGCEPRRGEEPSLTLDDPRARVVVEHSILGTVRVRANERVADPLALSISDSVLDSTRVDGNAVLGADGGMAFVALTLARTTVFGRIRAHAIELVENSIATGRIEVARRQTGCVRHSYVSPGSRTPRRYRCEPDTAAQRAADDVAELARQAGTAVDPDEEALARLRATDRVRPVFTSTRYGVPTYARLGGHCADEIVRGADDGSELGAFHDLYQPQRTANLRQRLDEHTPAGTDAGIFHAT